MIFLSFVILILLDDDWLLPEGIVVVGEMDVNLKILISIVGIMMSIKAMIIMEMMSIREMVNADWLQLPEGILETPDPTKLPLSHYSHPCFSA